MKTNLYRHVVKLAILLLWLPLAIGSAQAGGGHENVVSIARARTLPLGTEVTVAGTVSTPSGAFQSSFFDLGFGLQDVSAGIFISSSVNNGAKPGDRARITGVLQDSSGLLILVPASTAEIVLDKRRAPVRAEFVATGSIGEETEGSIVEVVGRITEPPASDLPFGYKFAVDDGSGPVQIFINTQTGIDPSALALGQVVSITGFSSQFEDHYEIDPRFPRDIKRRRH